MRVKELFEVIDINISCPDIISIADLHSKALKTFKYSQEGRTCVDEMLNQFGDRIIIPHSVVFGTAENGIDYIILEVK